MAGDRDAGTGQPGSGNGRNGRSGGRGRRSELARDGAERVVGEAAEEAAGCFLEGLFDGLSAPSGDCCAAEASFGPDCFVATAAVGPQHPDLDSLRAFRDRVLRRSLAGRAFIAAYYRYGAHLARFIADKPRLKAVVREGAVRPLARLARRLTSV